MLLGVLSGNEIPVLGPTKLLNEFASFNNGSLHFYSVLCYVL
jgi:hypothetical protein